MPRALIFAALSWLAAAGLPAQDWGERDAPVPTWSVTGPEGPVIPGTPFTVTARVTLPPGYYQDKDSSFLTFEPVSAIPVSDRWSSAPTVRDGKQSFTGTFTLRRTLLLPERTPPGRLSLEWKTQWQICQLDGVCLLPAEGRIVLPVTVASASTAVSPTLTGLDFWGALLAAFLGGLLLNLMPCVFPVLALKALSLASASGRSFQERRKEALYFAAGGWGTLAGIGLVTAAFSTAGQRLDWGFSFQQPAFIGALLLVFWAFTLQLWGLWSWRSSPFSLSVTYRTGPRQSLAGGAFLVVAAVPCTAPLLGPALGFALGQPPALVPLFFASVGLGLVAPLLVLQWIPGWSRFLPKPGPWMVTAERVLGFVLSATVLYLLWILTKQTEPDRVWPALGFLTLMAGALVWADHARSSRPARVLALGFLALLIGGFFFLTVPPPSPSPAAEPAASERPKAGWTPFSQEILQTSLAAGKPVFVDATAAWCATCQVNEAAVLDRPDVAALFERLGIVRLRADDTLPNPLIRSWLASVERAGLPVYALYRPGKVPLLFPELLTDDNLTRRLPGLMER